MIWAFYCSTRMSVVCISVKLYIIPFIFYITPEPIISTEVSLWSDDDASFESASGEYHVANCPEVMPL